MCSQSQPRRRTGRPRSAQADQAILAATRAALVDLGWGGLTITGVASRAGVAKTTLYRRWPNKSELVVDAVAELFDEIEIVDRGVGGGSLRADVEGVVRQLAALLERPETGAALMAVVAEATRDDELRTRFRQTIVARQKELVAQGRRRAQRRGEMAPDAPGHDPAPEIDLIFDVIAGAVLHRTLISGEAADVDWAKRFAALLLGGLGAR
jgi:AcrR family transcriptional regulator